MDKKLTLEIVSGEQYQQHETRKELYDKIEKKLGKPIISFFTSFKYPVMIDDNDTSMIEALLKECKLDNGFYLMISSPGGNGLAAERIINICRSYSGSGEFGVIVPNKAKSAATMVCLGSSEIMMSKTSELGPIDPQISFEELVDENGKKVKVQKIFSVFNLVKSYDELFKKAVSEKGNLEPYLQQLQHYDSRDIEELRSSLKLSEDIAIKSLKTGMLNKQTDKQIKSKINTFLTPKEVKVHARPIYYKEASKCGLNINLIDLKDETWSLIYELSYRLSNLVSINNNFKCLECKEHSFTARG